MVLRLLFVSLAFASAAFAQTAPGKRLPYLTVQVVDTAWSSMPGVSVLVRERFGKRTIHKSVTDREGFARFWFAPPNQAENFDIEASLQGFRTKKLERVNFGQCSGDCATIRKHVQMQLEVAGPFVTIH